MKRGGAGEMGVRSVGWVRGLRERCGRYVWFFVGFCGCVWGVCVCVCGIWCTYPFICVCLCWIVVIRFRKFIASW